MQQLKTIEQNFMKNRDEKIDVLLLSCSPFYFFNRRECKTAMRSILSFTFLLTIIQLSSSTLYSCDHNAACGCSNNSATLTRIVGGEAAGSRTWGWAVSLLIRGALCGGSIISETWIITAAHCVRGAIASEATIYAGSNTKLSGSQIRSVSAIVPHPNYDPSTSVNDIALLEMSSPLNMSDHGISIICLPNVSSATLFAGEWPPAATTVSVQVISEMKSY